MKKLPLLKLVPLVPKLVEVAHALYDLATRVQAGTITTEQAHADLQVVWDDLWVTVLALAAH